ncbi:MAG TPA: hypothetical protein VIM58_11255 [Candidatus Methylacidiphilales bacterium]
MRRLVPLLCLLFLLCGALPASLRAVAFRVPAVEENTVAIGGEYGNRVLRYDAKRKELTAILTIDYTRYASSNDPAHNEDLYFTFKNVSFDPESKDLTVVPPAGGAPVPIGTWKDGSLGGHVVLLYETTVLVTIRDRTSLKLAMDVDTERTAAGMKAKEKTAESQPVTEPLK